MFMDSLQALILGIVQGLTEFLPISSSGHLVIVPWLLGWPAPGLLFDTVLHLGTLVAVLLYFRSDIVSLLLSWVKSLTSRSLSDPLARLAWLIVVASVPASLAGVLFKGIFESAFSSPALAGTLLLCTAVILVLAEEVARRRDRVVELGWWGAVAVGVAQAFAIFPGISRSGATIAVGLTLGLKRAEAARFSFLLAVPVVLGAGGSQLLDLARHPAPDGSAQPSLILLGFLAAAVSGYLAIGFLMRYLRSRSLYLFAGYTALIGVLAISAAITG